VSSRRLPVKALNSYLTNHVQLDRVAKSLADTSVANAGGVIGRALGFQLHVCAREGQPSLSWLLNGEYMGLWVAFGLEIRCVRGGLDHKTAWGLTRARPARRPTLQEEESIQPGN
jgi:hypothetical protein